MKEEAKKLLKENPELVKEIAMAYKDQFFSPVNNSRAASEVVWVDFINRNTTPEDYEILSYLVETKKGWEVLSARESLGCIGAKIHSVKRLDDGEMFTVGDNTQYGTIEEMGVDKEYLDMNHMMVKCSKDTGLWNISTLRKVKSRTPLFVTEDGRSVFEDDFVFYVNGDFQLAGKRNMEDTMEVYDLCGGAGGKYFFNRENAEKYILQNKPCLSLAEVIPYLHNSRSEEIITELVKSKP